MAVGAQPAAAEVVAKLVRQSVGQIAVELAVVAVPAGDNASRPDRLDAPVAGVELAVKVVAAVRLLETAVRQAGRRQS